MLEGTLGDFSLPDIFQLIALTKKTGALTVSSGEQQGRVLFNGGEVSFAVADVQRVALGARLYAAGLVDEERITNVLERKRDQGGDVLAMLVEEAALDEGALDAFIREQIQDAVFELMRLDAAGFSFDAAPESDEAVGLTVSTEQLIMEGTRRMEEWASIREHIPSAEAVPALSPSPPTEGETVSLGVEEWRLLAVVDGRRAVHDVVALTGKSEFATSKMLAELSTRGFIDVVESGSEPTGALADMVARRDLLRRLEEMELGAPVSRPEPPAPEPEQPEEAPAAEPTVAEETSSMPTAPPAPVKPAEADEPKDAVEPVVEPATDPEVDAASEPGSDDAAVPEPAADDTTSPEPAGDGSTVPAEPASADDTPAEQPQPLVAKPAGEVDRTQVARELASLGFGDETPRPQANANGTNGSTSEADKPAEEQPHMRSLTRDEDVNKGLLLRLIDGVKGA